MKFYNNLVLKYNLKKKDTFIWDSNKKKLNSRQIKSRSNEKNIILIKKALESFLGNVSGALQGGGRVSLVGFGSWSVTRRAARDGRNPQTGATIRIAAKNVVKFKAGAELAGSVN